VDPTSSPSSIPHPSSPFHGGDVTASRRGAEGGTPFPSPHPTTGRPAYAAPFHPPLSSPFPHRLTLKTGSSPWTSARRICPHRCAGPQAHLPRQGLHPPHLKTPRRQPMGVAGGPRPIVRMASGDARRSLRPRGGARLDGSPAAVVLIRRCRRWWSFVDAGGLT
jgi:hypothetical protein